MKNIIKYFVLYITILAGTQVYFYFQMHEWYGILAGIPTMFLIIEVCSRIYPWGYQKRQLEKMNDIIEEAMQDMYKKGYEAGELSK